MHFSSLYILSVLPFTLAQYGGDGGGGSTTSSAAAAPATTTSSSSGSVHTVTAGNGGFQFSPNSIVAAMGDTVEFHFYPPLHSVAQSTFDAPCVPSGPTAFFSGPMTTASGQNANVFTLTINDTNPIWFYCGVPTHCESGMAGVINPPSGGNTIAAYIAAAAKATTQAPATIQGGVIGPAKVVTQSTGSTGSSTSSAASTSSTAKSAGVEARGGVQWVILAITGVVAAAVGSLIV